jgi:hypothetical protein
VAVEKLIPRNNASDHKSQKDCFGIAAVSTYELGKAEWVYTTMRQINVQII